MTNGKHSDESATDGTSTKGAAEEVEPFRVVGSLKILVPDEDFEAGIAEARRRQAELFEAKMRSISE